MSLTDLNLWPWYYATQRERDRVQQLSQNEHEINWLYNKIAELEKQLNYKPSVKRQISEMRHQIRRLELQMAFSSPEKIN
jgi:hypothetical protein